jgi:hypothetical protein
MLHYSFVAAVLLLGAATTAPAKADWEYTKWGMTPEQVASASKGTVRVLPKAERKVIKEAKMESGAEGTYRDGMLELHVMFSFDTDGSGLKVIGYNVTDAAQNDLLKTWLIKKYGEPKNKSELEVAGITSWDWSQPDDIEMMETKGYATFVLQSRNR